jgi:membrane protein
LPDVKLNWRDVWVGAAVTAVLFTLGKYLIGLYLGRAGVTSAYGAAGSFVAVLLWIYYSSLIFLFGAEFTRVYAIRNGRHIEPLDHAVFLTAEEQARQGIPRPQDPEVAALAGASGSRGTAVTR